MCTIASFNRIRTLTGGANLETATSLVKEVLSLSSLVTVDPERDMVRLAGDKWKDYLIPDIITLPPPDAYPANNTVTAIREKEVADRDGLLDGEMEADDTDDDIVFVLSDGRSPLRRNWAIASPGPPNAV